MWNGFTSGLPPQWPGRLSAPWRQEVQRRRTMLFDELARLQLTNPGQLEERAFLIGALLEDANLATQQRAGVRKWWWGTEVERAWARLREVEQRMTDLLPDDDLRARAARASAHGSYYLDADDQRLQHLAQLRAETANLTPPNVPAGLRPSIIEVLRASHAQADHANQEARYLRNRLLTASALSVLFGALIVVAQGWLPHIEFLGRPDDWHASSWIYLLIVMLFGGVGALFTAIPTVSKIPSDYGPFNLPMQQALLKIVFGPLVAVIGLTIVGTQVLQLSAPKTWPGMMLLAVVFGAGQHAVTRYVDQRAGEILTAATPPPAKKTP